MPDRHRPPDADERSDERSLDPRTPPDALLDGLESDVLWQDTDEAAAQRAEQKRQALEEALERGKTQVRLDARRPGVRVPQAFAAEPQLALNLSWRFAHTQMVLNERGVAATLRFSGQPFRCVLPWSCLWGIVPPGSETVKVWPADLPPELGGPPRPLDGPEPPPVEPVRPRLAVVGGALAKAPEPAPVAAVPAAEPAPEPPAAEPAADEPKPKAPWLKLVR